MRPFGSTTGHESYFIDRVASLLIIFLQTFTYLDVLKFLPELLGTRYGAH